MSLISIDEPVSAPHGGAAWALGFRPFYLGASVYAALAMPLWIGKYLGWWTGLAHVDALWHMHEMVFGMALAVVVGFLYTAARNWTGQWTPRGGHLMALFGLWLAGRVAMLVDASALAIAIDVAFLPCAAWPLLQVMRASGNRRNYFLPALLMVLAMLNLAFHAARFGALQVSPVSLAQAAIFIIVVIESVIGTRVIPMFTRNGAPGANPLVVTRRDRLGLALMAAAAAAWLLPVPALVQSTLAAGAAALIFVRLAGWQPQATLRVPLLWILHLSYAWIGIGFALLALAAHGIVTPSTAFHALTVGSMAGLIIGMMTRTTLGHTGRMLKAGRPEVRMYVLIQAGAVLRLLAGVQAGLVRDTALTLAALAWTAAFALFAIHYGPYLLAPRIDGKEG
ncbi:MAG: NnrS family protein [Pseudomonadota bacterium]